MEPFAHDIVALIGRARWREAVTYRDTWPHEYVVIKKDGQEDLLAAFCERIARGEGVECLFFGQKRKYLFLGEHKYWIMTDCLDMDLEAEDDVLNRAQLYRDRRDFVIQPGDTGMREGELAMAAPEDGIEQMDVRKKWKHESLDFTPWLAKNLHLLGDALGLKLEPVQTEVPVGPYFLDILAREADEGVLVAIENQLEETDLSHLGQLLTYATGCGAHVAIWVAPEFGYEHAQALHRLNEWTNARIRFFGVKLELIKKASGGHPEPRFRKVVYPGGWSKEVTLRSGEMPSTKRRYYEFFQPLVTKLLGEDFADKAVNYFDHTGRFFPSRIDPNIGYAVFLYGDNSAWVTLHVRTEDNELTKHLFDELKVDQEQIERSVDAGPHPEWQWLRYDRYAFSTINIRIDGSIDDSPEKLEETKTWMLDLLPKLKEAFDPRLAEALCSK